MITSSSLTQVYRTKNKLTDEHLEIKKIEKMKI